MSVLHSIGSNRKPDGSTTPSPAEPTPDETISLAPLAQRLAGPRSLDEAEERYVVARDAWIAAMRGANSGRSADLASLAIAQQAYEHATAEAERWRSGLRVAISVEPEPRADIEVAIGQQVAWQRLRDHEEKPRGGFISRVLRRVMRRG